MRHRTYVLVAAAMAVGFVAAGCGGSHNSSTGSATATSASTTTTSQATATATTSGDTDLPALIPTPANTARTDGPDSVHDGGIHLHFLVNGSPMDVMGAYKTAILGKGWSLIVDSSSGGAGGGTATYTASNGNAYGVFTGGGYGDTTDVEACAWPSQPAHPDCGHGNR
ncbi:hypothetical protein [Mycobacterium sp.]|uniref:hypothetical protein n=1 Tax=Mycobacterium sp. TaxID=1785 RepID=UPI003C79106C